MNDFGDQRPTAVLLRRPQRGPRRWESLRLSHPSIKHNVCLKTPTISDVHVLQSLLLPQTSSGVQSMLTISRRLALDSQPSSADDELGHSRTVPFSAIQHISPCLIPNSRSIPQLTQTKATFHMGGNGYRSMVTRRDTWRLKCAPLRDHPGVSTP